MFLQCTAIISSTHNATFACVMQPLEVLFIGDTLVERMRGTTLGG